MAIDQTYKKQLKQFGVEFTQAPDDSLTKKERQEFANTQADVIKNIMSTVQGRQWIYSKLDAWKVFTTPFIPTDAHGTSFFAGIQACGHSILNDVITNASEGFTLMLQEAAARSAGKSDNLAS